MATMSAKFPQSVSQQAAVTARAATAGAPLAPRPYDRARDGDIVPPHYSPDIPALEKRLDRVKQRREAQSRQASPIENINNVNVNDYERTLVPSHGFKVRTGPVKMTDSIPTTYTLDREQANRNIVRNHHRKIDGMDSLGYVWGLATGPLKYAIGIATDYAVKRGLATPIDSKPALREVPAISSPDCRLIDERLAKLTERTMETIAKRAQAPKIAGPADVSWLDHDLTEVSARTYMVRTAPVISAKDGHITLDHRTAGKNVLRSKGTATDGFRRSILKPAHDYAVDLASEYAISRGMASTLDR